MPVPPRSSTSSTMRDDLSVDRFRREFAADHQTMTRGMHELLAAVQSDDLLQAQIVARRLDQQAGPHIQFEEEYLYPQLVEHRDPDFVAHLYQEHELGRAAVAALIDRPPDRPLTAEERDLLITRLQTALEHAFTCGSLLSYASHMPLSVKTSLLEALQHCRSNAPRWSELPRHDSPSTP